MFNNFFIHGGRKKTLRHRENFNLYLFFYFLQYTFFTVIIIVIAYIRTLACLII
jgi:hypothetical protein